jgi:hypothetical protein
MAIRPSVAHSYNILFYCSGLPAIINIRTVYLNINLKVYY